MKSKVISIGNLKKTYFSDLKGKSFINFFLTLLLPAFICNIFKIKLPHQKHTLLIKKLDIYKGEIIGLIGNNGAGKSTLLKVLSGITNIDSGLLKINGIVFPILELGAGFSDDLSGRENILMLGSLYGFSHQFIKKKLSEIIQFGSLDNFIDRPYDHYSSGMKARLAFSFAVSMSFDILLIDEALAVGDMDFQSKALAKLNALNKEGVTILLVSHDINSLRNIASKIIWLDSGKVKLFSKSQKVSTAYLFERAKIINENNINLLSNSRITNNKIVNRYGSFELNFDSIELLDNKNQAVTDLIHELNYRLSLIVKCKKNISNIIFGFSVNDMYGNQIFVSQSKVVSKKFINGKFYKINIDFKNILLEGRYYFSVAIEKPILKFKKHYSIDVIPQIFFFKSHLKSKLFKKSSGGYVNVTADFSILDFEKH